MRGVAPPVRLDPLLRVSEKMLDDAIENYRALAAKAQEKCAHGVGSRLTSGWSRTFPSSEQGRK